MPMTRSDNPEQLKGGARMAGMKKCPTCGMMLKGGKCPGCAAKGGMKKPPAPMPGKKKPPFKPPRGTMKGY